MADILQITEDIPVDDSIYEYEYREYNPIMEGNIRQNSIGLHDILICHYYMRICFLAYILYEYYISYFIIVSAYCIMTILCFYLPRACMINAT